MGKRECGTVDEYYNTKKCERCHIIYLITPSTTLYHQTCTLYKSSNEKLRQSKKSYLNKKARLLKKKMQNGN